MPLLREMAQTIGEHVEVTHQQWSHRNVTLICGPPASGKSTFARQLHRQVIELETIVASDHREALKLFGRAAYRIGRSPIPDAAIVRGAPGVGEREHHERLCRPARTIILLTPAEVCHARIDQRDRDEANGEHEAVDRWWRTWYGETPEPEPHTEWW